MTRSTTMLVYSEGDRERITHCWGVFLLHFYAAQRTKYALEALRLKFQLASLPPPLAHQLKWNRFINTHGGPGHNLPCDLHNKHVNKLLKEIISNMGANLKEEALTRAARSVTLLKAMRDACDKETGVPVGTTAHSTRSAEEDIHRVVSIMQSKQVFAVKAGRYHSQFPRISANPLHRLNMLQLTTWIKQKQLQFLKCGVTRADREDSDSDSGSDLDD